MNTLVGMNDGVYLDTTFLLSCLRMAAYALKNHFGEQRDSSRVNDPQPFHPFLSPMIPAVRKNVYFCSCYLGLDAKAKITKRAATSGVKRPQKVGQVKHYPVIERVRYCTGLFPFNRDLILLLL